MITNAILILFLAVIKLILFPITLLGDVALSSNFSSSLATAGGYLKSLDNFLPISTMFVILGISLTIELAYFGYKAIMWLIKKIPSIN